MNVRDGVFCLFNVCFMFHCSPWIAACNIMICGNSWCTRLWLLNEIGSLGIIVWLTNLSSSQSSNCFIEESIMLSNGIYIAKVYIRFFSYIERHIWQKYDIQNTFELLPTCGCLYVLTVPKLICCNKITTCLEATQQYIFDSTNFHNLICLHHDFSANRKLGKSHFQHYQLYL